ncbi:MAG TPA: SdrD B-like domain-containing protein [Candidatus Krumholzibacteria bacterium]|nr:SdrD B-like domain-containing protein [Candidatus Krumholzibacteria bacterium]
MRWHYRLLMLCTAAVLAAGCSNNNQPANDTTTIAGPNASLTACETYVGDFVFLDANCNGVQDGGEAGVAGVNVKLYTCEGILLRTTTTDANGHYEFTGFQDDVVKVFFELPTGYSFSPKDQGGVDAADSDAGADGYTDCFLVECDKPINFMDAGLCGEDVPCESSVGDRVWFDANCNGVQDKDESGVPNVTVELRTCEGGLVSSTTTDGSGGYLFTGLESGSYKICVVLPDGYDFAPKDQGGNDGLDSDVNADGCTDCFELDCNDDITRDAGLCERKGGGSEGCTPGFWRNHLSHWAATPYSPDMLVNDVFGCTLVPAGVTLGQAIDAPQTYGVLPFHAIAALLNATHPDVDYAYDVSEIIDAACSGDKDKLADANEAGCTLSGGNTTGGGNGPSGGKQNTR